MGWDLWGLFRRQPPEERVLPPGMAAVMLDKLPPHCDLAVDVQGERLRFQAVDADGRESIWSGWFTNDGEPIMLYWDAFWVGD